MKQQFSTIHWGLSGYTVLAASLALVLALYSVLATTLALSTARQMAEMQEARAVQAYELRMVPRIAGLCKSYWAFEHSAGIGVDDTAALCDTFRNPDGDLPEAIALYVQGLDTAVTE